MRWLVILSVGACLLNLVRSANPHGADIEDNDFAEFEEFDDEGMFKIIYEDIQYFDSNYPLHICHIGLLMDGADMVKRCRCNQTWN